MMLTRQATIFPKGVAFQFMAKQNINNTSHITYPLSYRIVSERLDAVDQQKNLFAQSRWIHVTAVNRDLEAGLRSLGAGVAATGVIGSGIGLGLIFGNFLSAVARNPSVANRLFGNAIMGAAFCESLGLFAIAIAFVIMA